MAVSFVKMDLPRLQGAMTASAGVIRALYAALYQQTGKAAYSAAAQAGYEWDTVDGFAAPFEAAIDALLAEGGSSTPSGFVIPNMVEGVDYTVGSFNLSSARTSVYSITHGLGTTPQCVVAFLCKRVSTSGRQYLKWNNSGDAYGYSNTGNGANALRHRTSFTDTTISLNADSTSPLDSGRWVWFAFKGVSS